MRCGRFFIGVNPQRAQSRRQALRPRPLRLGAPLLLLRPLPLRFRPRSLRFRQFRPGRDDVPFLVTPAQPDRFHPFVFPVP